MIDMNAVEKAYKEQILYIANKVDALGNPVKMKMTVQQFADEWIQSGHWDERGRGKGKYCMARNNDIGHYEVGNVRIILHSENVSEAKKGKPHTAEHKAKNSAANKGRSKSAEHNAKNSASRKGKPVSKIQCPHCGTWGPSNNMKRYHFDNCKRKGEH